MKDINLIYLRKSRQDNPSESIEETLSRHEQTLQDYAVRVFGEKIPEKYIFREVVSGESIAARPEMQKILNLMEKVDINGVLVVDPQRLSRGDLVDCGTISNTFRYTGTICYTPTMTYHIDNKHERKYFESELMRGGEYLDYVKEILQRGRIISIQNGNYIGSIAPYGYKKVEIGDRKSKHHTLEIVPEEAECIRTMYDLYVNKNIGFAALANELDQLGYKPRKSKYWSPAALKDIIENPIYIGKLRWNWRKNFKIIDNGEIKVSRPKSDNDDCLIVDGLHEPIVSEDIYNAALAKKGKNIRVKKSTECRNPYSGILYCQCGRSMSMRTHVNHGKTVAGTRICCNGQRHCKTASVLYSEFEDYIISVLKNAIREFELELENCTTETNSNLYATRIEQLHKELLELDTVEEEQYDLLESKIYTREIFIKRNTKLQQKRTELQSIIDDLETKKSRQKTFEQKLYEFKDALNALQNSEYSAAQKNLLLKKCIQKVTYSKEASSRWDSKPFSCKVSLRL